MKQKGVCKQKSMGNADLMSSMVSALFWNFHGMNEENHEKLPRITHV